MVSDSFKKRLYKSKALALSNGSFQQQKISIKSDLQILEHSTTTRMENDTEKKLTLLSLSSSFHGHRHRRCSLEFFATRFLQPRLSRLLLVTAEAVRLLVIVVGKQQ